MTTGDPGTEATVTNSGTEQDAVFDFTIPQGKSGGGGNPVELLSAYSTPPKAATAGNPLLFDINSLISGDAISHTEGSGEFTINEAGIYTVAFNGGMAPVPGVTFPINMAIYVELNGTAVPGTSSQHTFHTSTESINQAFTVPVEISTVPSTIRIIGEGGNFFYSSVTAAIYKIGESAASLIMNAEKLR